MGLLRLEVTSLVNGEPVLGRSNLGVQMECGQTGRNLARQSLRKRLN
jgi:hypothetical protein